MLWSAMWMDVRWKVFQFNKLKSYAIIAWRKVLKKIYISSNIDYNNQSENHTI